MNRITITKEEAKENAIKAMENCMAYITVGRIKNALMSYGEADVWAELLTEFGCYLIDEDEHFANMIDIADNEFLKN